ncbi:hypothetical protein [Mycobacterium paragordonae]|uniref:hypothetical protein n=1 Tax=Mycobacterium paragordonae TaxID=1389713 RepID=UPI0012E32B45|nr:hypothetical protein [Mycobacterium paragordonae]
MGSALATNVVNAAPIVRIGGDEKSQIQQHRQEHQNGMQRDKPNRPAATPSRSEGRILCGHRLIVGEAAVVRTRADFDA